MCSEIVLNNLGIVAGARRFFGAALKLGVGVEGTFAVSDSDCSGSGAGLLREEGNCPKLDGDADELGDETVPTLDSRLANGEAMPVRTRRRREGMRATVVSSSGVDVATGEDSAKLLDSGVVAAAETGVVLATFVTALCCS
jgi:hypothetical protein